MLPYGMSDFQDLKLENYYYIDKTDYIPKIELYGRYLYLIRPRRFGKSLFLNMIAFYYDVFYKDLYEEVFKDTYILNNPTKLKNNYHILKFDFSAVSTVGDIDKNFSDYCNVKINSFLKKYSFDIKIDRDEPAHKNLNFVFDELRLKDISIYIMIDEYDNFINNILIHNQQNYQKLVSSQSEAIYKEFFKLLKSATTDNGSVLKRMFMTGVSPLAMFDVTSGSNIGTNITNEYAFNDSIGVTKEELEKLLNHYNLNSKFKIQNSKLSFDDWYNNYKFSEEAEHTIYNTDMVLYYLKSLIKSGKPPRNMVDLNIRTDYAKLRYLVYTDKKLNGNFTTLQKLFGDGYITTLEIKDSFSAFEMKDQNNFISLLYHLGFITIDRYYRGEYYLKIPNQTIRIIMAEYIQIALKESDIFDIDLNEFKKTIRDFAYDKSLEIFEYLAKEIEKRSKVRDFTDGENLIKGFFMAYFSLSPFYAVETEVERNKGFVDILLTKAPNIEDEITTGLIEFKYIKRGEFTKAKLDKKIKNAKEQLDRYKIGDNEMGVIVVFNGWELVYCQRY